MKKHPYHDFNTGNNYLDEALENYLMRGFQPGGFLTSVLEHYSVLANDLFRAVGRADSWNKDNLPRIVTEINRCMPVTSYGDYQYVKDWLADKDGRRSYYVKHMEEQRMWDKLSGKYVEPIVDGGVPF